EELPNASVHGGMVQDGTKLPAKHEFMWGIGVARAFKGDGIGVLMNEKGLPGVTLAVTDVDHLYDSRTAEGGRFFGDSGSIVGLGLRHERYQGRAFMRRELEFYLYKSCFAFVLFERIKTDLKAQYRLRTRISRTVTDLYVPVG